MQASEVHLLAINSHAGLVYEFVFSELRIQSSKLQAVQFQCESRPTLLQVCSLAIWCEFIPMMAEEDEVTLIVDGDNSAAMEVRCLREHSCKHATDTMASHRIEVIEDKFWRVIVTRWTSMIWQ